MKHRKLSAALLSGTLALCSGASVMLPAVSVPVLAQSAASLPGRGSNMAQGKTAVASSQEADSVRSSNATDGNSSDYTSRWGSNQGDGPDWIYVDLGEQKEVGAVRLFWENRKATAYKIQTADANPNDESSWTSRKVISSRPASTTDLIEFDQPVSARYVRLYIDSHTAQDPDGTGSWNTVSIYEFEIYGAVDPDYQDPTENIALNKTASADSTEAATLPASAAVDGNEQTRWASEVGDAPHWFCVDLGKTSDVKTVRILWETRKPTQYRVQTAEEGADLSNDASWTTQKQLERPDDKRVTVTLDSVVRARYVRVLIDAFTAENPDGTEGPWNNVSINELAVYGGEPASFDSISDVLNAITIDPVTADMTSLPVRLPETSSRFTAAYNGTDLEQVVGADLAIYPPVTDKTVKVSFKVTDNNSGDYQFKEIPVTIPGRYSKNNTDNLAPAVLPELQEWKGRQGSFAISADTLIAYSDDKFAYAAQALADDYKEMSGVKLSVQKTADAPAANAIVFGTSSDAGLGDEGYELEIGDSISVKALHPTGAYWATRSILQAVQSSADGTIARGIARDYPTMKLRGIVLDVGRKTFTMDFLKQFTKVMAWYKMNDFQVHLNDNYIWVNEYWHVQQSDGTEQDRRLSDVYSGFRMESDIKKGGNGGKNKEDLTAKDVFYTKEEFSAYIDEAKNMGVTIVPEFDMPAHALSMTKVRPDLVSPDSDLPNQTISGNRSAADHLDLNHQYDEVMDFIKSIWNEYILGEDKVFDTPIIHIGADEYEASSPAYRKYVNDMFDYAEENGYQARVWGSLKWLNEGEEVLGSKVNPDGTITRRQADIWSIDWAEPKQMYDLGFELINILDSVYYIVPNAGYYADYLSDNTMYNRAINTISGVTIPAGDEQMSGGAFAVWNDMSFDRDNGMSEYDIYQRLLRSTGLYAANGWGKGEASLEQAQARTAVLNDVPGTNFGYETETKDGIIASIDMDSQKDTAGPGNDLSLNNASIETIDGRSVLHLDGSGTASLGSLETVGLGNSLRVKVNRQSASKDEQILFESPYGSIKAVQKDTGRVGFSRENRDYSFQYELPVGVWTELEIRNEFEKTSLYVNGEFVETIGTNTRNQLKATMMLPIGTIGSQENSFIGYVDDIRIGQTQSFASTAELDAKLQTLALIGTSPELVNEGYALSGQYNPSAADISSILDRVNAAIASREYEKADYERTRSYLSQVPEDLSCFTKESADSLTSAIEAINYDVPKNGQHLVDQMTDGLIAALGALEIRTDRDLRIVDQSTMKATASSYQPGEDPSKAIDGTTSTMWHTEYSNTTLPHWLDIEFETPEAIDHILYTPRASQNNGIITSYKVQTSNDGITYTDVKTGTLANNNSVKDIALDTPVTAKHIRLVATAAHGNFGSCSEINFVRANAAPDKAGLKQLIDSANGKTESLYGPVSYSALSDSVTKAQAVYDNASADLNTVENAKSELKKAIAGLLLAEDEGAQEIDYTLLLALIDDINTEKLAKIEPTSSLRSELSSAKSLINNARTQAQVDQKTRSLHQLWLDARFKADSEELKNLK